VANTCCCNRRRDLGDVHVQILEAPKDSLNKQLVNSSIFQRLPAAFLSTAEAQEGPEHSSGGAQSQSRESSVQVKVLRTSFVDASEKFTNVVASCLLSISTNNKMSQTLLWT
jgi:hypothetical protein